MDARISTCYLDFLGDLHGRGALLLRDHGLPMLPFRRDSDYLLFAGALAKIRLGRAEPDMRYFVTGCAGFIGSMLTERLLSAGHTVVGLDNLSTGRERFLSGAREYSSFRWVHADVLDPASLTARMSGSEFVFHLAANADVRFGFEHPHRDLEQNILATHAVLEAMRKNGIGRIAFSSSGSVYGDT